MDGLGQKVRSAAEMAATLKTAYDVGKTLYNGAMYLRPVLQGAAMLI
jgi:hypothetical protein